MEKKRLPAILIQLMLILNTNLFYNVDTNIEAVSSDNETLNFPSDLNVGDLFFCDVKPYIQTIAENYGLNLIQSLKGYSNDHVGMYIGDNKFIEATPYFYAPVQKEWIGVVITPHWLIKTWATNITFGYVNTDQNTRDAAVSWAKKQLGKPYGENGFYCDKLIFDSYKKQGLKLTLTWPYNNKTYDAKTPGILRRADQVIMYSNIPPEPDINDPSGYHYVNDTIYFTSLDSIDIDGMIMKYIWDFGDGTCVEKHPSVGREVKHVYKEPDEYTVTLTVIDNAGASGTDTARILIKEDESDNYYDADNNSDELDGDIQDFPDDNEYTTIEKNLSLELFLLILIIFTIAIILIILIWILKR
jgi:hypothetical protein